jgi:hypothetical protein
MKHKLLFAFSILFLFGCNSISELLKGPGLPGPSRTSPAESADMYYKLLMWKYYDKAMALVGQEERSQFEDFVQRNKDNLNITDYQVKKVILDEDGQEGTIEVMVTFYKYPSVSEKTLILDDNWILSGKEWYISPDFEHDIYK